MGAKEDIQFALSSLLKEKGVKNSELASAIGVSNAAVTNWIKGANSIDMDLVPKICDFLGVSIDEFFGRKPAYIALTEEEALIVASFRKMDSRGRSAMVCVAEGLALRYGME